MATLSRSSFKLDGRTIKRYQLIAENPSYINLGALDIEALNRTQRREFGIKDEVVRLQEAVDVEQPYKPRFLEASVSVSMDADGRAGAFDVFIAGKKIDWLPPQSFSNIKHKEESVALLEDYFAPLGEISAQGVKFGAINAIEIQILRPSENILELKNRSGEAIFGFIGEFGRLEPIGLLDPPFNTSDGLLFQATRERLIFLTCKDAQLQRKIQIWRAMFMAKISYFALKHSERGDFSEHFAAALSEFEPELVESLQGRLPQDFTRLF